MHSGTRRSRPQQDDCVKQMEADLSRMVILLLPEVRKSEALVVLSDGAQEVKERVRVVYRKIRSVFAGHGDVPSTLVPGL